jgi:hypothetical protein
MKYLREGRQNMEQGKNGRRDGSAEISNMGYRRLQNSGNRTSRNDIKYWPEGRGEGQDVGQKDGGKFDRRTIVHILDWSTETIGPEDKKNMPTEYILEGKTTEYLTG